MKSGIVAVGVTIVLVLAAVLVSVPFATAATPGVNASATAGASAVALSPTVSTPSSAVVASDVAPGAPIVSPVAASGAVAPRIVALDLPGPHPSAWGSADLPPGMPTVSGVAPTDPGAADPPAPCYAVSPATVGQAILPGSCVGHDEPTIGFYSISPGSGGNATWNGTLPTDVSTTQNQSSLYATAFFGLVAADSAAWLGQCYVELQLYPDFSWTDPSTSTAGAWSGAVVGWQVDPTSGDVDTCFYEPLWLNGLSGDGYFQMTQGDSFSFVATGWPSDPSGETFSLTDLTSGNATSATLYNATGGFPLDPAYPTNSVPGALLWSTGGQLPLSFGFEIGRAGNPSGVSNNTYNGCNPGPNAPTPGNHAVPCASYNPVAWINDTQVPWSLSLPTFFNAGGRSVPSQVDLASSVGGNTVITNESGGTCTNRIGSAYCTYPWFGYSCTPAGYTFGATDYASESNDFGEGAQFPTSSTLNLLGLPTYLPAANSQPNCGAANYTVSIGLSGGSGGSVDFLSELFTGSGSVSGVGAGDYSLLATPPSGAGFLGWTVSGSVAIVGPATSPSATLRVAGAGSVTADFTATPALTSVFFNSTTAGSSVVVAPGSEFGNQTGFATVPVGGSVALAPGVYGIQAGPAAGTAFASFDVTSGAAAAVLSARSEPVTWLTVTGAGTTATVTVSYTTTVGGVSVLLTGDGNGTVSLNGQTFPYSPSIGESQGTVALGAGTFAAVANPAPGWVFVAWSFTPGTILTDFNESTNVTFPAGIATLTATFAAAVTLIVTPLTGGDAAFGLGAPVANGTTVYLVRGEYALNAVPNGYFGFSHWTASSVHALWILKTSYPITHVWVNDTGSVTVSYVSVANVSITFHNVPASGGSIVFNYLPYSGTTASNTTLGVGEYLLVPQPAAGFTFSHWNVTDPPLSLASGILTVSGGGGVVTATYTTIGYPITFVGGLGSTAAKAVVDGITIGSGQTASVPSGTYPLNIQLATDTSFLKWINTGKIYVQNRGLATTNLTVQGAGTLAALIAPFAITGLNATPPFADVGVGVTFTAVVGGVAPTTYVWHGLPTGCTPANENPIACTPTVAGTYSVYVTASGILGLPVKSPTLGYAVGDRPVVSGFSASRSVLDVGMSTELTVDTAGGTPPLSFAYAGLPTGCTGTNSSTLNCTPTAQGVSTVEVTVSDLVGINATANLTLTVNPTLTVTSLIANRAAVTQGIPFALATNASGGSPSLSYAYTGLPASCLSLDRATLGCTPGSPGTYAITVNVTDAAGAYGLAATSVLVNPLPTVTGSGVAPEIITLGQSLTFWINATGGTGPLTYHWVNLPTGCAGGNVSTFTCTPTATYSGLTVTFWVSDSDNVSSPTAGLTPVVNPTSPSPSGGTNGPGGIPWWVLIVIVVAILAGIVGSFLILRRGRTPPPTAAAAPSGSPPAAAPPPAPPSGG